MELLKELGPFPIVQTAVGIIIALIGTPFILRGFAARNRADDGSNDARVPIATIYLREIGETLKRIERMASDAIQPRRRRRRR